MSNDDLRESLKRYYALADNEVDKVLSDESTRTVALELVELSSASTQSLEEAKKRLERLRAALRYGFGFSSLTNP